LKTIAAATDQNLKKSLTFLLRDSRDEREKESRVSTDRRANCAVATTREQTLWKRGATRER
jgi:hypothetical protein